jgi:conserved repeat domain
MKRALSILLSLSILVSLGLFSAVPVSAAIVNVSISSGTSTEIVGVYNKAGGGSVYVDLSGSPLSAVLAQEPKPYPTGYVTEPPDILGSVWDTGTSLYFQSTNPGADWIWETQRAEGTSGYDVSNPLYDAAAYTNGRVVVFEQHFTLDGTPQAGTLHITADNCWEVFINGVFLARSSAAKVAGWELTNLHEAYVATTGWQTVGHIAVPDTMLVNGENTITILAANEYFWSDDGNSPSPAFRLSPYYQYNPGGLIFKLDVGYEEFVADPGIQVEKEGLPVSTTENTTIDYTYTVTNTGNVPLSSVAVVDNLVSPVTYQSGDDNTDGLLDLTEVWVFTGSYLVPWFTAGPVDNTATAEGYWDTTKVTDEDTFSVPILHTPNIEVDKTGPANTGYFEQLDADYTYTLTNIGNCSLDVDLTDDQIAGLVFTGGDTNGNGYLEPGEIWTFTGSDLIVCEGITELFFTNIATAVGTDATGAADRDTDDWTVTIFQWQPRTIGYWGNWDNHWSTDCITDIVNRVNADSAYFSTLTAEQINTLLLSADQKGKMTQEKARILVQKQLLAAWLSLESYIGATDGDSETCGALDAAMRPGATVYLSKFAGAETLFGASRLTVAQLLALVDTGMSTWTQNQLLIAKDVLDMMNNAKNNGYFMFMAP